MLHIRAQGCSHILFYITDDLLELVNGDEAGFIRLFQILKDLIQSVNRCMYIS